MATQIPEEALHKVLQQIQAQVVSSQRQLGMVRVQVQGREREKRMHELTLKQLQEVQPDTNLYRGVGKMFMMESRETIVGELVRKEKEAKDDIANLTKKQKYLEKQFTDAQAHMRDIFRSVDAQQAAAAAPS